MTIFLTQRKGGFMDVQKRMKKMEKLHNYILKCMEKGEVTDMSPTGWLIFSVQKGLFIPILLEKTARESISDFDKKVYGSKQDSVPDNSPCSLCSNEATMMRRYAVDNILKITLLCDKCFDEHETDLY